MMHHHGTSKSHHKTKGSSLDPPDGPSSRPMSRDPSISMHSSMGMGMGRPRLLTPDPSTYRKRNSIMSSSQSLTVLAKRRTCDRQNAVERMDCMKTAELLELMPRQLSANGQLGTE